MTETFLFDLHQIAVACDLETHIPLRAAYALAGQAEAELTAVHVIPPLPPILDRVLFPYAALGPDRHDFEAELLEAARRKLLKAAAPICGDDEIYAHIFHGAIADRIRESLSRTSAQILVIGPFGERAPTPGALGSTAMQLARNPLRPLLIVKKHSSLGRTLVLLQTHTHARRLLNFATSFALHFPDPELELFTPIPDPRLADPDNLTELNLGSIGKLTKRARARIEKTTARFKEQIYIPFPRQHAAEQVSFTHHMPFGDPVSTLLELLDERDIDTLVLASAPTPDATLTLGPTEEAIIRRAGCNVLLIPHHLLAEPAIEDDAGS